MFKKYIASSLLAFALISSNNAAHSEILEKVGEGVGSVGRGIGKGVGAVGRGVGQGVGATVKGVGQGVGAVGRGVGEGVKNLFVGESPNTVVGGAEMTPSSCIVDNLGKSKIHTNLSAAIKQSGLEEQLGDLQNGPYTLFAPTDEAFKKLPAEKVAYLMKDENKDELKEFLSYHIVPGIITTRYLRDGQTLTTINGEKLKVDISGNKISINGAPITTANVVTRTGVVHVTNSVITKNSPSTASERIEDKTSVTAKK